jgi:hypothetical protein
MEELKKQTIDFLSILDGNHSVLKTLHWNADKHCEHLLTDDIDDDVLEFEDSLAEQAMGCGGFKFGVKELKSMIPNASNLKDLLSELKGDTIDYYNTLGDDKKYAGIRSSVEEFISKIDKWAYLETFS